jgi:hypothetical protein
VETSPETNRRLFRSIISKPVEEHCLSMLLQWPQLRSYGEGITPDYFENSENRIIFENWRLDPDINKLKERIDVSLQGHVESLSQKAFPYSDDMGRQKAIKDCILRLQENYFRDLKIKEGIMLAELHNLEEASKILENGIKLNMKLKELFTQRRSGTRRKEAEENG